MSCVPSEPRRFGRVRLLFGCVGVPEQRRSLEQVRFGEVVVFLEYVIGRDVLLGKSHVVDVQQPTRLDAVAVVGGRS